MAFVGIEFVSDDDEEAGIIALIHCSWFTPRKKQVWWPPYKTSAQLKKALFNEQEGKEDTWTLYNVKRTFFVCDDFNKANKKLKECEEFSDLQSTELEDETQNKKRKRKPNLKYMNNILSSEDEREDQENVDRNFLRAPSILYKSPRLKNKHFKAQPRRNYIAEKDYVLQEMLSNSSTSSAYNDVSINVPTTNSEKEISNVMLKKSCGNSYIHTHTHIFHEQMFAEIKKLREQVKEKQGILKQSYTPNDVMPTSDDIPVDFPLKTREELQNLENYLNSRQNRNILSLFLSTLGGDTIVTKTNRILKHVLTNELAKEFNYVGQNNSKEAFEKLHLKNVIIRSIQIKSSSATEIDIEKAIKIWLKHAPERVKESLKRKTCKKSNTVCD